MNTNSRYHFPGLNPNHLITAGWDAPLTTFFAQVFDSSEDDEDENEPILWLGDEPRQIPNSEMLVKELAEVATIPTPILENLEHDHDQPWSPSPLQLLNRKLYEQLCGASRISSLFCSFNR
jgi:hypothetical protein